MVAPRRRRSRLRLAHVRGRRRPGTGHRAARRRALARERAPARSRSIPTGTYTVTTADGVVASGLGRLVDGGDGGDTYNYSPPTDDVVVDHPEAVTVTLHEAGPVRAQLRVLTWYRWPHHAVGDERRVHAAQRRADPHRGGHHARAARRRAVPAGPHRARPPLPRPPAPRALPAAAPGRRLRRRVRVRGRAPRPHRRGRPARDGAADVRVAPLRRRIGRRRGLALLHDGLLEYEVVDDGSRARAHAPARHRLPLPLRDRAAAQPGRPARPARGPAAPGTARASSTRSLRTPATGSDAELYERPTSSSCRSSASASRVAATARSPVDRCASTVPSSRRSCARPAGSWCGSSTRRANRGPSRSPPPRRPTRGWLDRPARPSRRARSRARFELRAAGIATVRLDP